MIYPIQIQPGHAKLNIVNSNVIAALKNYHGHECVWLPFTNKRKMD